MEINTAGVRCIINRWRFAAGPPAPLWHCAACTCRRSRSESRQDGRSKARPITAGNAQPRKVKMAMVVIQADGRVHVWCGRRPRNKKS